MDQHTTEAIHRPSRDYQPLHDVIFGLWGYPAVLVAHDLKVFHSSRRRRAPSKRSVRRCISPAVRPARCWRCVRPWGWCRSVMVATR